MTIAALASCLSCQHFYKDKRRFDDELLETHFYCAAFPDGNGIPFEIISGGEPHKGPYPGDNGIQYEPNDE